MKKTILQIVLAVALLGGGIYLWMDQFRPAKIEILCNIHPPRIFRNNRANARPAQRQFNVAFGFNGKYYLNDVKVVPRDEWLTNKLTQPLWHMVRNTNAVPLNSIVYGQWIRGMKPAVKGARPAPLETNVVYRLLVTTDSSEGQCDFKLPALPQTAAR